MRPFVYLFVCKMTQKVVDGCRPNFLGGLTWANNKLISFWALLIPAVLVWVEFLTLIIFGTVIHLGRGRFLVDCASNSNEVWPLSPTLLTLALMQSCHADPFRSREYLHGSTLPPVQGGGVPGITALNFLGCCTCTIMNAVLVLENEMSATSYRLNN